MPGFQSWKPARASSAARQSLERQTPSDDELELRNLGEVVMEVIPAAAHASKPNPAVAQSAVESHTDEHASITSGGFRAYDMLYS